MTTLHDVLEAALKLPQAERQVVVDTLEATLTIEAPLVTDAWKAEIKRRSDDFDSGNAATFKWEEVKEHARRRSKTNG